MMSSLFLSTTLILAITLGNNVVNINANNEVKYSLTAEESPKRITNPNNYKVPISKYSLNKKNKAPKPNYKCPEGGFNNNLSRNAQSATECVKDKNDFESKVGPILHAKEDDVLKIEVNNRLCEGHTTHWHGMKQMNNSAMDGVDMVSQFPINVNQNFRYEFRASPAGTH
eukprot:Pgem_evm1s2445